MQGTVQDVSETTCCVIKVLVSFVTGAADHVFKEMVGVVDVVQVTNVSLDDYWGIEVIEGERRDCRAEFDTMSKVTEENGSVKVLKHGIGEAKG